MTHTFTPEHKAKLEQYLATHDLPEGLGTERKCLFHCSYQSCHIWDTYRSNSRLHV
jgi:hypothetical protein